MSETAIEWTERSWNPIVGCSLASPGCTNCYAMAMARRLELMGTVAHYAGLTKATKAGPVWTGKLALAPEHVLTEPLRRRKPTTWFVNSMGDLFHEDVPDEWIDRVFAVMALCPQHTFQVLTKRAGRMREYVEGHKSPVPYLGRKPLERIHLEAAGHMEGDGGYMDALKKAGNVYSLYLDTSWPLRNVWLGVSAEDQRRWDERVDDLKATPAAVHFVSAEPLLGSIIGDLTGIDWIIVGGESGPKARPMHPDWARGIRDQCAAVGTAFFFKQWGEWKDGSDFAPDYKVMTTDGRIIDPDVDSLRDADRHESITRKHPTAMRKVGKKRAGRLLDGVEHNAMPQESLPMTPSLEMPAGRG